MMTGPPTLLSFLWASFQGPGPQRGLGIVKGGPPVMRTSLGSKAWLAAIRGDGERDGGGVVKVEWREVK